MGLRRTARTSLPPTHFCIIAKTKARRYGVRASILPPLVMAARLARRFENITAGPFLNQNFLNGLGDRLGKEPGLLVRGVNAATRGFKVPLFPLNARERQASKRTGHTRCP